MTHPQDATVHGAQLPRRILLVEDDLDQAHLIRFLLEGNRVGSVTLAQDGVRGQLLVRDHPWALVITDLNLPGADGLAVVEAVRQHQPGTPILATTGYAGPEYLERAIRLGADEVLMKPLDRDTLLRTAMALLQGGEQTAQPGDVSVTAPVLAVAPEVAFAVAPAPPPPSGADPGAGAAPRTVLAIGLRPGDIEGGCGGTLLRHRRQGDRIILLTLTHGVGPEEERRLRSGEARSAGRALGARTFVGNAEGSGATLANELRRLVEGALHELRPDLLYLPTGGAPDPLVREFDALLTGGDLPLPPTLLRYPLGDAIPNLQSPYLLSIQEELERKVDLAAHFSSPPAHLAPDRIRLVAAYWGGFMGREAGEPFELIRGTVRGELEAFLFSATPATH